LNGLRANVGTIRSRRGGFPHYANVRYWPKADMTVCTAHVRFQV
jgi:hypothetical protein